MQSRLGLGVEGAACAALLLLVLGCPSSGSQGTHDAGGPIPLDSSTIIIAGPDAGLGDASGGCTEGQSCGDGGICTAGSCCPAKSACGSVCCAASQVCAFQKCVTPTGSCLDSTDCPAGKYCDYTLGEGVDAGTRPPGCSGGATLKDGRCLPTPPICSPDAGAGTLTCLEKCEYKTTGAFSPVVKFTWGGQVVSPFSTDVMMMPIVVQLDDDDCDGKVTERDIPEIVFTTFTGGAYTALGTLHAIAIVDGVVQEKWSVPGVAYAGSQIAGGDIDGQPGNEVVACGAGGTVVAFHGDGTPYWTSPAVSGCRMPAIADLDQDGKPEVIVEGAILDGATGAIKATFSPAMAGSFVISDLDGDGWLDIVSSSQAFHADGTLFVDTGVPGSWPAVGDFDKDGVPEVVAVHYDSHTVSLWHYDKTQPASFSWVRQGVDINGLQPQHCPDGSAGFTHGGGPPTIADFDGDGLPDVALAGGIGYSVLDGAKLMNPAVANADTVLWAVPTTDCSSAATGSAVFDFDGDGKAEVVYSDENHLRIYEGPTGKVLWETCNTTGTLEEYPVIADVDNDGHAEIVVVSNSYANGNAEYQCNDGTNISQAGVRVFGDANGTWVRTRRVWNEHAYHITNVNEDGTIPRVELPNWEQSGLDNFRQNKQPGQEFAAPDAIVSALEAGCKGSDYSLVATVTNIGQAALPAGVTVGFYSGKPPGGTLLGKATTTQNLYSAQSENVSLLVASPPPGLKEGTVPAYCIVDDSGAPHPAWHECRTDNNSKAISSAACAQVN